MISFEYMTLVMLCDVRDARYNGSTRPNVASISAGMSGYYDIIRMFVLSSDGLYYMTRSAASRLRGSYVPMVDARNDRWWNTTGRYICYFETRT